MVWVKFLADFSYKPMQAVTLDYPRGTHANVPTPVAQAALAAGLAIEEVPEEKPRTAQVRVRPKVYR